MDALTISAGKWNAQAAIWLMPTMNEDQDYTINDLAYDVQSGVCTLIHVEQGGEQIANMVLRKDDAEMVVVALGGHLKKASLSKVLTPYVENIARQNGCKSMRVHFTKQGIARLAQSAGWKPSEIVYRKTVH